MNWSLSGKQIPSFPCESLCVWPLNICPYIVLIPQFLLFRRFRWLHMLWVDSWPVLNNSCLKLHQRSPCCPLSVYASSFFSHTIFPKTCLPFWVTEFWWKISCSFQLHKSYWRRNILKQSEEPRGFHNPTDLRMMLLWNFSSLVWWNLWIQLRMLAVIILLTDLQ